jgi:hypothetical protein
MRAERFADRPLTMSLEKFTKETLQAKDVPL